MKRSLLALCVHPVTGTPFLAVVQQIAVVASKYLWLVPSNTNILNVTKNMLPAHPVMAASFAFRKINVFGAFWLLKKEKSG